MLFLIVPLLVIVELTPTIIVPLFPLLVISPPELFVIVVPESLSETIIALLADAELVEIIWPLFTIVVLSAPGEVVPRIVFPPLRITPPLLFVIDTLSDLLMLIAFDLLVDVEIVP